jgi:hypothetical protein
VRAFALRGDASGLRRALTRCVLLAQGGGVRARGLAGQGRAVRGVRAVAARLRRLLPRAPHRSARTRTRAHFRTLRSFSRRARRALTSPRRPLRCCSPRRCCCGPAPAAATRWRRCSPFWRSACIRCERRY